MRELFWDVTGDRSYESGIDRGVLYLPDGSAVPWNGLAAVTEKFDKSSSPVYFDGRKIADVVVLGDFSATMKAWTYPDEFIELEGSGSLREGVFFGDQPPQIFGLSYRTRVGTDQDADAGYKIHILYNVTAIPHDRAFVSESNSSNLAEFEWDIFAVPEEVPGFRPTAHIIIDSRRISPTILSDLEDRLYGTTWTDATLMPMSDMVLFMTEQYTVRITDNGDGTWTATTPGALITYLDVDHTEFQIDEANAVFVSADEYRISDSLDAP